MFGGMGAELIVFVGLQASGKSTFFRERFAATHDLVSKVVPPSHEEGFVELYRVRPDGRVFEVPAR